MLLHSSLRALFPRVLTAALWKGLGPRLARVAPGQAITWSVVSQVMTFFERKHLDSVPAQ